MCLTYFQWVTKEDARQNLKKLTAAVTVHYHCFSNKV